MTLKEQHGRAFCGDDAPSPDHRRDLIFISLEDWDEIWRRNQLLCTKLIERNPAWRILFIEPAVDVSYAVRSGNWNRVWQPRQRAIGSKREIVCVRPIKLFPNAYAWGRRINEWLFRHCSRRSAHKLGMASPVLWINAHAAVHMAGKMGETGLIYDITDDWIAFENDPRGAQLVREQDSRLCRLADRVIVCSERLLQLKLTTNPRVDLIPNGVDIAHYEKSWATGLAASEETRDWRRPVIGYTGTVHSSRVDVALLETTARLLPHATFVLIGPMMLPSTDADRLGRIENIRIMGAKPYAEIPDYVRAFDICMTPHLVSAFTDSLNPIKLWEYLASGKPIVSTPVAGFRDYPDLVYLVENAAQFTKAVSGALREEPGISLRRRSLAAEHSWDRRAEQVESIIASVSRHELATVPCLGNVTVSKIPA